MEEKEEYRLELEKCEVALNIKNTLIEQLEIKILNMVRKK